MKPTIFLCCPRLFDIRYLAATGVITSLAEEANVVIFVPGRFVEVVAVTLGNKALVRELLVTNEIFEGISPTKGLEGFRYRVCRAISTILGFVYDQSVRKNISQDLHIKNFLRRQHGKSVTVWFRNRLIVGVALLLSYSRVLRRSMQQLFFAAAPKSAHRKDYELYRPALAVICTFGLGSDGILMAEARYQNVPIVTAVQSWDKTSTKGYPTLTPDAAILWSDITAEEANQYLNVPNERIYVEGAPLWDRHFRAIDYRTRQDFFYSHGLDPKTKLVAVSIGSPCYHKGNLRMIDFLIGQMLQGEFVSPISLLFRQHPGYLSYERERYELNEFILRRKNCTNVAFMDVELNEHGSAFMYREADSDNLCEMFFHCDLSVSIVSSHLIESAIFGKPAINIEYGQWSNEMYDFDLSQYTAEHLYRIYRTGAVYRVMNEEDLVSMANQALSQPFNVRNSLARLVAQEASINQGCAAASVAKRLLAIAQTGSGKAIQQAGSVGIY